MKLLAALLTLSLLAPAASLQQTDRERVLSELHASRKQFLDAIAGLSPAQWTFKATPDRWSIAEVAEHIIAAEAYLGTMVTKQIMGAPADAAKAEARKPTNSKTDEAFLAQFRDRSQKAQAPDEIAPKGTIKTPADAADAFKAVRDKTLDYVRTTEDALRDHFFTPVPGTELDGVQGLLMIAGQNERHVLQMLEVKHAPAYPAK